jgi:hypothetical protein
MRGKSNDMGKSETPAGKNGTAMSDAAKSDAAKSDTRSGARLKETVARMKRAPKIVAVPVGIGLILGGTILAPLPIFGVWMAPLGLAILAPHSRRAHRATRHMRRYWIIFLRWAIARGFLRVKEPQGDDRPPSAD